tara:strand:+ start:93 stop:293 length:201 start_codon:yes stop_codon:yes gene_type:complete
MNKQLTNTLFSRVLCNGKTSAFQADDRGSIPLTRSKKNRLSKNQNVLVGSLLFFGLTDFKEIQPLG